jgi:hypothetical protein
LDHPGYDAMGHSYADSFRIILIRFKMFDFICIDPL